MRFTIQKHGSHIFHEVEASWRGVEILHFDSPHQVHYGYTLLTLQGLRVLNTYHSWKFRLQQ